jgi:class 3 adenylate cyclase/tetratricopeptide (TPR) repeat protein
LCDGAFPESVSVAVHRSGRRGGLMTCPSCGNENQPGRKFCGQCGSPLALACPSCGAGNPPTDRFCGECGSPLADGGAATGATPGTAPIAVLRGEASREGMPQAPLAERRLVSVLFADLVGFTTLSEGRDAEEVRELLSSYFDTCRKLVGRYGGTVEKFIGDAVMAVWGAPVAQEDDAERAVRTGIDLLASVQALGTESGAPDLKARAGVLTGEAAVTLGAQSQGMVAGDLVNTASRIQSAAEPGTILVGEATHRATEAAISYEDAGLHELKGKAEPVHLWRALRVVAARGGALKSSALEPPFVGRDRELRQLKDLFHRSADEHKAHQLSIFGIAGIGKSRLAWEFFKYLDGLLETVRWHRGRCLSYGEGVTYWALAEMVRSRARIVEGEEQASVLAKLRASVEEFVADPDERRWIEPRLAHLIGAEERTAPDPEDLFSAWRLFFERMAEREPTVMVFEDMQWADASLIEFIDYLMNWSKNHPLFVITLARPELADRHPQWGAGKRAQTSLYLEPLADEAMGELLSGLVPGLPLSLASKILERAQGVPLYAVETVRMLLDRALLVPEGGAYRLTGPVDALEVPETLQALIAARLDGLTPAERGLIQDAAVLGKTFTKPAVATLTRLAEAELEPVLSSLVRKEILFVQSDPRSPERGQYGFLQDLVRKIAYDTLSKRDRKARHLAAAAYLEESWGPEEDEIVEVVASHYVEAFRAAPDASDAAEIKAKARDALVQAGRRAASLAAADEARHYFEQAIELADDEVGRAGLHEQAGRMAWTRARIPEAKAHFEEALALFGAAGESHAAARVSSVYGQVLAQEGHSSEAVQRMERAFEVLSPEEPDEDLATLAAELGRVLTFIGQADKAAQKIELALQLAESLGLPEVFSQALNTKAVVLSSKDRIQEALILLHAALEVALDNDLPWAALRAYNNLGSSMDKEDRYREEIEISAGAVELARRVGNRPWELKLLAGAIGPMVQLGRWDDALVRAEELRELQDLTSQQAVVLEMEAIPFVHVQRGDLDQAKAIIHLFAPLEHARTCRIAPGSTW